MFGDLKMGLSLEIRFMGDILNQDWITLAQGKPSIS